MVGAVAAGRQGHRRPRVVEAGAGAVEEARELAGEEEEEGRGRGRSSPEKCVEGEEEGSGGWISVDLEARRDGSPGSSRRGIRSSRDEEEEQHRRMVSSRRKKQQSA